MLLRPDPAWLTRAPYIDKDVLEQINAINPTLDRPEAQLMFSQAVRLAKSTSYDDFGVNELQEYCSNPDNIIPPLSAGVSFESIAEHVVPEELEIDGLDDAGILSVKIAPIKAQLEARLKGFVHTEAAERTLHFAGINERFNRTSFLITAKAINTLAQTGNAQALQLRAELRRTVYLSAAVLIHKGIGFSELQRIFAQA